MKRLLFLLGLLLVLVTIGLSVSAETPAQPASAIYIIEYDELVEIEPLLAYDLWQDRVTDGSIRLRLTDAEFATLAPQFPNLTLDEVQTAYLNDTARTFGDEGCYRTVEETATSLATLEATYPSLISTLDIGDSYEKATVGGLPGYDILTYILTNENANVPLPKPILLILSTVHAREYTPAEFATRFSEHLLTNYGVDPDITWMLDYYAVHIIPQGNPDGRKLVEVGTSWRKNRNPNFCGAGNFGIDLNRNASYQWGLSDGSSGSECSNLYRGPFAGSEVETSAFEDYALSVLSDQRADDFTSAAPITTTGVFLTMHSYGPSILPTWSWTDIRDNPNYEQLMTFGRKMAFYNDYLVKGTDAGFPSPASGSHDDFVYGELGVPSYTYELGTTFSQPCADFEDSIYPDNLDAVLYAFKQTRQPYLTSDAPDVLDVQLTFEGNTTTNLLSVTQGAVVTLTATVDETRFHQDNFYQSQNLEVIVSEVITAANYTIDAPDWVMGTVVQPMSALDGAFDEMSESVQTTIDTSDMTYGKHTIFVTATDATGKTGAPTAIFLNVEIPLAVGLSSAETSTLPIPLLTTLVVIALLAIITKRRFPSSDR